MILIIVIFCLGFVNSRCLLWNYFYHRSENLIRRGFGYESFSVKLECNDFESFYQCQRGQELLDKYNLNTTLNCYKYIACAAGLPLNNGKWWCIHDNSHNKCVVAQILLSNINVTFPCNSILELNDDIPVLFYTIPPPKLILPPTNTTSTSTESTLPGLGNILNMPVINVIGLLAFVV